MTPKTSPWQLVNADEEFRDFDMWLHDNEQGVGGYITITLVDGQDKEPSAYGTLKFNKEDGEEITPPLEFDLTRTQAEQILGNAMNQEVS